MTHPTRSQLPEHVETQRRLFENSSPGCVLSGRTAYCPTCATRRPAVDLPSTGVVSCLTCGTEYSARARA